VKNHRKKWVLAFLFSLAPLLTGCVDRVTSFTIDGIQIVATGEFNPPQPVNEPIYIVYSIAWISNFGGNFPSISGTVSGPDGSFGIGPITAGAPIVFNPAGRTPGTYTVSLITDPSGFPASTSFSIGPAPSPEDDETFPDRENDAFQIPFQNSETRGDDIALHSGEFIFSETDLTVESRGLSFMLERTYRSQLRYNGPLGYGWDFSYNQNLFFRDDGSVRWLTGRGMIVDFQPSASGYIAPDGLHPQRAQPGHRGLSELPPQEDP